MSQRKEHLLSVYKCLWVGADLVALMWTELDVASYQPVFSQVHSPLLPALLCTSGNYVSQAPLPLAGGWECSVGSIHLRWSPELGKHSWLSSCSPPCLLYGSNNCQTHPSFTDGPRSWPLGILVSFQPREGKGFLLMLNLGLSPFPPLGHLGSSVTQEKNLPVSNSLCLKSLARILLDYLDPQGHRRQTAPAGEELHRLWPAREGSSEGRFNLWEGKVNLIITEILHAELHDSLGRLRRMLCAYTHISNIKAKHCPRRDLLGKPRGQSTKFKSAIWNSWGWLAHSEYQSWEVSWSFKGYTWGHWSFWMLKSFAQSQMAGTARRRMSLS